MEKKEFFKKASHEGAWIIKDASDAMKAYVKKQFPDNYEEEIKKYKTPEKYIITKDEVVIVSLTEAEWGGIMAYDKDDVEFYGNQNLVILKSRKTARPIIDIEDYMQEAQEETITYNNANIKTMRVTINPQYYEDMVKTGFISREEIEVYLK